MNPADESEDGKGTPKQKPPIPTCPKCKRSLLHCECKDNELRK